MAGKGFEILGKTPRNGKITINTYTEMKKITTVTVFNIIDMPPEGGWKTSKDGKGSVLQFKTRRQAESYCAKNKTGYVEIKHIFYR